MSIESQLFSLTRKYCASKIGFDELTSWVQDREEHWASLPAGDPAKTLADTIMLAAYEVWAGERDEASARKLIADSATAPASST